MKKFLLLTCSLITLLSCTNELEFSEHAFQATKNSEFWKASDFSISINDDGFMNLVGVYQDEVVSIYLESAQTGTYNLKAGSNSTAWFTDGAGHGYTTEYKGDGEVIIEKYDVASQSYTGSFKFNAVSSDGEVANFINGIFYQVPITTEIVNENEGELKASIDESELEAVELEALNINGMIEVQGKASDGSYIKLYIPETTTVGSFNLNEQSDSGTYAVYGFANGTSSIAQYGTLFINEHNVSSSRIKGTFTFTTLLPNSVSVENGNFTAYY